MNAADAVRRACDMVPGMVRSVLAILPEGFLLGAVGGESTLDYEPLIRSAARCMTVRASPAVGARAPVAFVEYAFVVEDEVVVIQAGRHAPRLVLAVVCTREPNLSLVLSSTRAAMRALEAEVDLRVWGVA